MARHSMGVMGGVVDLFDFIFWIVCFARLFSTETEVLDDQVLRHTMHLRKL